MAKNKYQNKKQNQEARQAEEARLIAAGLMEAPKSKKQLAEEARLARLEANKAIETAEATVAPTPKKPVDKPVIKKAKAAVGKPSVKIKKAVRKPRKQGSHAHIYETNFGGKYRMLRGVSISIIFGLIATIFIGVGAGTVNQPTPSAPSELTSPVEQPLVPSLGTSETIEVTTPPEPTP